jgi:dolichyl-phosphate beta-glucosyltransferase
LKISVVIPCFNEAERLDANAVEELISADDVDVILVDDGSTDGTWQHLEAIQRRHPGRVECLKMHRNVGKAESVRHGMNHAVARGADVTGYTDADFATPPAEMLRLIGEIRRTPAIKVLFGSRWLHMGSTIQRSRIRHYTGRVFATFASMVLRMPVYDTQCGAKLFRVSDSFRTALVAPFLSRWAFDVELIGRLREGVGHLPGYGLSEFVEVPLNTWIDVGGSKIGPFDMIRATLELLVISSALKRLRQ